MFQSNFDYPILEEIEQDADEFYYKYDTPNRLNGLTDEAEKSALLKEFYKMMKKVETPLYLLVIAKRILVDGSENYGDILILLSRFCKLIKKKRRIKIHCIENPQYKETLASLMFFLLPHLSSYIEFRNENDESNYDSSIACFSNLFTSLIHIKSQYELDSQEIFNFYIDSLLIDSSNNLKNVIALKFASKLILKDQVKEKIIQYVIYLLNNLSSYNLDDNYERIIYNIFFTEMIFHISNFLTNELIDRDFFLGSINSFFEFYLSKFNPEERIFPDEKDIKLIENVFIFLKKILINFIKNNPIDYQIKNNFISSLVNIVYPNALSIVMSSNYYLSSLISGFFLLFSDYLDINLIQQNQLYFFNLIQELSYIQQSGDIMSASQEIFYIDYYDINFFTIDYLSNRQNVAQFIHSLVKITDNTSILDILSVFLLQSNEFNEFNFYLLSIINKIAEIKSFNDERFVNLLFQLLMKYLESGSDFIEKCPVINQMVQLVIFSFSMLINSSFYVLSFQQQNQTILELYHSWLGNLFSHVQNYSGDEIDDNFYGIYFTLFCILANQMAENGMLQIEAEHVSFTMKYFDICISNDAIKFLIKFAIEAKEAELVLQIFHKFIEACIRMVNMVKFNETKDEKKDENKEEEEEDVEDDDDDENKDDDKNKIEHELRFFNENVSLISDMIRNNEFIDPSEFIFTEENKLIEFARMLLDVDKNEDWSFSDPAVVFYSALFSRVPNLKEWLSFYFETSSFDIFNYIEWLIPIIAAISNRPKMIEQDFVDSIISTVKSYINEIVENDTSKLINTKEFLTINSLVTRLFELTLFQNISISPEDFAYFFDFVFSTIPSEDDCQDDDDYDKDAHELGALIFKLTSFLVKNDEEQAEIGAVFEELYNENKIACNEIRYIIIFLIDNVLGANDDENLNELRRRCLENDLEVDQSIVEIYEKYYYNFVINESHPIFKAYSIENFVLD